MQISWGAGFLVGILAPGGFAEVGASHANPR
jgi:hypothetical protein